MQVEQSLEKFKVVPGYSNYYINKNGVLLSIYNNKIKTKKATKKFTERKNKTLNGYLYYMIYNNGKSYFALLHRLLAITFIENTLNKPEVNHIDGNTFNNSLENLEWVTKSEQQRHAWKLGLRKNTNKSLKWSKKLGLSRCKLSPKSVLLIRKLLRYNIYTQHEISKYICIPEHTVNRININKIYKEV